MPTQLSESVVRDLALTDREHVVVEAMTLRLLLRDRATLTGAPRRALRDDQIAARVRAVRAGLARADDADRSSHLADALDGADIETAARVVDDAVAVLGAQVTERSRALLVLVDVCLFAPDRTSWNARARHRALTELTAALPAVRLDDLERVRHEVAAARRALAWRRVRWGRIVASPVAAHDDDALRLAVATCLVVIAERGDVEGAKRVARVLQERLDAAVESLGRPADPVERNSVRQAGAALEAAIDLIR